MSSTDKMYEDLDETEIQSMEFMCRRLGMDHFIIAGYDSKEFNKHVLSRGWHEGGAPKIGINASVAGLVFVISRILTEFPFSEEVRRGVHSVVNSILTGREIKENKSGRDG